MDGSTDISTSQNVVITVRFPDSNSVGTKFWDLVPIFRKEDTDGAHEGATTIRSFFYNYEFLQSVQDTHF